MDDDGCVVCGTPAVLRCALCGKRVCPKCRGLWREQIIDGDFRLPFFACLTHDEMKTKLEVVE